MSEPLIYPEVSEICRKLGFGDPNLIRSLTLTPVSASAVVYKVNAAGEKFVDPETGEPATETREFSVIA